MKKVISILLTGIFVVCMLSCTSETNPARWISADILNVMLPTHG